MSKAPPERKVGPKEAQLRAAREAKATVKAKAVSPKVGKVRAKATRGR